MIAASAGISALGGLAYIAVAGTIGGFMMDLAFAGYGFLTGLAALQAVRFARAADLDRHRAWALRLFVLAIGSWLYRVHYGIWYALTGGIASNPEFTGIFDRLKVWAFFLPYLVLVEIYLRARPRFTG